MRRILTVIVALSLFASTASAGTPDEPEITDEIGDVDVQHLIDAGLLEEENLSQEQVETVGDLVKAWVHTETEDSFQITVQLAEIPDQENTSAPLMEVWTHWTVNENAPRYHAQAVLVSPQPGAPLQANYKLYQGQSEIAEMAGNVDTENDTIRFTVEKQAIGDVGEGDRFTEAYATSHLPTSQATVDYAPGTKSESLPTSEQELSQTDPTSLNLAADPNFGPREYTFQSFETPEGDLSVTVTPSSIEIPAGEQAKVSVRVTNGADETDTAQLSIGSTPSGWSATLDSGTLEIPAGDDRRTFLRISPAADAQGLEFVDLEVSSSFSGETGSTVAVTATQPSPSGGGGADDTGSTDDGGVSDDGQAGTSPTDGTSDPSASGNGSGETNDSPFVGPVALLGAILVASAVAWERRLG